MLLMMTGKVAWCRMGRAICLFFDGLLVLSQATGMVWCCLGYVALMVEWCLAFLAFELRERSVHFRNEMPRPAGKGGVLVLCCVAMGYEHGYTSHAS
jgi:hypothetical protein